jgi:iron complex transport system substrate-binding protein
VKGSAVSAFGFLLSTFAFVVACSSPEPAQSSITVRDDLDRQVRIPPTVSRVVTLAPNLTEIVFALGSGSKVVGTDDFSDVPAEVKSMAKVGGMQPDVEKIAALKPDLVIATTNGNHPSLAPALANASIPLFVVRTDRVEEIAFAAQRLGTLLGSPGAESFPAALRKGLAAQRRTRDTKPRILFAVFADPLYVAGRDTFSDDLFRLAGAENVVALTGWPQYSIETLLQSPPDIVLYPDRSVSRVQVDRLFATMPAGAPVVMIEAVDENRFTRPGPSVVSAATELNAIIDRWQSRRG